MLCISLPSITSPPSADTVQQQEPCPPLAESHQSKDVSSFSSSTSSPWDSPENPFVRLKPAPARAQSAPLTLPTEPDPAKTPTDSGPPNCVDAFSSVSWSQSQWIAFSDPLAPPRRPSVKEHQQRSSRFLSDSSADAYCRADDSGSCCSHSGVADGAKAVAPSSQLFNGNTADWWSVVLRTFVLSLHVTFVCLLCVFFSFGSICVLKTSV